ncbi:MAG: hypothetical protein R3205_02105, partial [Psychrobacter sp.]|nr:hypothetical protein [Psychrobacter sp.]
MTEQTAKPTRTLNDTKGATTSVIHKNSVNEKGVNQKDVNQKDVKVKAQNNQRALKNKQKSQVTAALDKAALLALFTLPNVESNSELSGEQSHLNTTNQISANQIPVNQTQNTATSDTNVAVQRVALYRAQ